MKKCKQILATLFTLFFIVGCSTSSDSNGNSTTTVVPVAPSDLIGTLVNNQVVLTWTDNSTNETGFKIERMIGTGNWSVNGSVATNIVTYTDAGITAGTTYTYRVYSFNSVGSSLNYSNEITITTLALPVVTTTTVTSIEATTATSGGSITSDGGAPVTARGVVWSTNTTPTIALPTKTTDGTGIGSFTSAITILTANTTYYIRAYATNSVGTTYGNELTFTTPVPFYTQSQILNDIDGNSYPTIITNCSNQTWMQKNLNVSRYKNGDVIPQVTNPNIWSSTTTGAWCYYNNDPANGATYGKLYNWYAVNDSRGLAPTGWHVPTDWEWTTLTNCLGGGMVAGGKMKETGTTHWPSPNTEATNSSGFTGLPGGFCANSPAVFGTINYRGWFWSSSETTSGIYAWHRILQPNLSRIDSDNTSKDSGFSVRCVKD